MVKEDLYNMWQHGITWSQNCKNENICNDDNMMCASVWFEFFVGLLQCQNPWYMGGECDNKDWDLNREHPFPKVLGYKRRKGIKEVDVTEFKM